MTENQVDRILRMLQVAIRMLGFSNREIERRLGWTPSYMTRILKGNIELKVEHVVDIAGALGLSPREFFLFAFPDRGEPPSPAALKLDAMMEDLRPAKARKPEPGRPEPEPKVVTHDELDQRIESALQSFFAKIAGKVN
ncbi:MAG TPA: helix-turn-helix transcriptional regulator [Thermoanaerobaculia bacterium]|jgi:transcriptional regulator with XRE-family HTH domain|nr:helix-turn-helix transcriptional regulator [Thermoanaerobaculia bacterium]